MTLEKLQLARSPLDQYLATELNCDLASSTSQDFLECLHKAKFEHLNKILAYAVSNSSFYRQKLANYDLHIQNLADLAKLPLTTPEELREHDYRELLCLSQDAVQRIVTLPSSGSTGKPKRIAFTAKDLQRTIDFFRVGLSQLIKPNQTLLVLLPGAEHPDGVADLLRQAFFKDSIKVYAGNAEITQTGFLADLKNYCPDCLVLAPHQLAILEQILQNDNSLLELARKIKAMQTSGDLLERTLRERVENLLDCQILDHFGMVETGFGGGVECFAKNGYHLRELDFILEIIDPETGQILDNGKIGEIVLTTLRREAMPLIRYRTYDAAAILPAPCACASSLSRLSPLKGRYVLENGKRILRQVRKGGFYAKNA